MIKILHTADWHIGKRLYKQELDAELSLFFDWLIELIVSEGVDILLVSGDIFDMANPSHSARKMYYRVLKALIRTEVKVVITGGNHDSITNLDASSEILNMLDIKVVGGAPEQISDLVFNYKIDNQEVVIAAIPFLRDKDLRSGHAESNRVEQLKKGIVGYYQKVSDYINKEYQNIPAIGMGHLYLQSASTSDSERDIQIGNQAGVESTVLSQMFDYLALGHIHRPQSFIDGTVRYSGSPISLSFSERKDVKQVVILKIDSKKIQSEVLLVPKFRTLLKIKGSLEEVNNELQKWKQLDKQTLKTLVEIEIVEDNYQESKIREINLLMNEFEHQDLEILKYRYAFVNSPKSLIEVAPSKEIGDLKPMEVFEQKLAGELFDEEMLDELKSSFHGLLEEAYGKIGEPQ